MERRSTGWAISSYPFTYLIYPVFLCAVSLFCYIIFCDPMLCETSPLFLVYMSFIFSTKQEKTFKTRLTNYSIIIYG